MRSINYISNLDVRDVRGGWSSFNKNVYDLLKTFASVNLVDAINPDFLLFQRVVSKVQRYLGVPALFPGFSMSRLSRIATMVEARINTEATLNFFHGSTPWIKVESKLPYACYLDASFSTYLAIYHRGVKFKPSKIFELETKFLREAKAVFFSSQYSLDQTRQAYSLMGENFYNIGLGGNLSYQDNLQPGEKKRFLFIGHDYLGKGGDFVAEAFQLFSKQEPGFLMTFMGGAPPSQVLQMPGVEYVGSLDKRKPDDLKRYHDLLSQSVALILPTTRDMAPLVIIEAGYCGCPSIASNAYGIPELIGPHGYLCGVPIKVTELAQAMTLMKNRKNNAEQIRNFYIQNFTWDAVGKKLKSILNDSSQG